MPTKRLPWQDELAIIDRTMKAISGVTDPETLVNIYWDGIGDLLPSGDDYMAVSRRGVEPPYFLVTRSSRFTEHFNPWTQRDRLPKLSGGLVGEIAYANKPVIIDDLPSRLKRDDPAWFYLEGFQSLVALPQYDGGEALNVSINLAPAGAEIDRSFIPMMHWQAGLFGRGTQNLVLRNQLSAAMTELDRELEVVGAIQRSLLPARLPEIAGFELSAHYVTSARAGGDYYDFFPLPNGRWGLFIADVSGHGTPAAVLMAITHALAHAQPGTHTPPSALLSYLNDHLARAYTRNGTFVTAFYAVLDPAARTLTYSAGGHNPPRLAHDRRVLSLDDAGSLPLGIVEGQTFTQAVVTMGSEDVLLLYTDGISEAMAPGNNMRPHEMFGVDRLDGLLLASVGRPAEECIARIRAEVASFCGNAPATDDQTLVAIRCL
ncbi:MAG TPA: PP2C family protein-serine/threonine phosphatase [Phycisphaerae bacterium]|nr:PP2C family protein-serine/threonine phosphatase [Phycisphaerae bacterium]